MNFLLTALVARQCLTFNPPNDNGFDSSLLSALVGLGGAHPLSEIYSSSYFVQKKSSEIRRWLSPSRNNPARFEVALREISITGET
jgi:hypothetical protein